MAQTEANPAPHERLGTVTCPSGILLILDGGLAWMWSHDREPRLPEWAEAAAAANTAVDLEVRGPDALEAGRAFDRSNHPLYVYDRPRKGLQGIQEAFRAIVHERELDAVLEVMPARVAHRKRVDQALAVGKGVGIVEFHGMWAGAVSGLPRDVPLRVLGERMPAGPDEGRWRRVWIEVRPSSGSVTSRYIGHVLVDEARLMAVDAEALGAWNDHDPVDGKADVVFWGRDAEAAAKEVGAMPVRLDGERELYGWLDLPLEVALDRGNRVKAARTRDRKYAFDFRPHTHLWQVMRDVRGSSTESGVLGLGGADLCMFMTSWGDGAFPVAVDLDSAGLLVRVRIELGCDDIARRQREMEERWFGAFAKRAIVSARVARDGCPVRFLYREATDRDDDSGWRLMAGDESDEYLDDPRNALVMPLRELVERDATLTDVFRTAAPCAFERKSASEPFDVVRDFKARS